MSFKTFTWEAGAYSIRQKVGCHFLSFPFLKYVLRRADQIAEQERTNYRIFITPEFIALFLLFLQALYLSNNGLKCLPSTLFKECLQLATLDLHNTEITMDVLRQVCTSPILVEVDLIFGCLSFRIPN